MLNNKNETIFPIFFVKEKRPKGMCVFLDQKEHFEVPNKLAHTTSTKILQYSYE